MHRRPVRCFLALLTAAGSGAAGSATHGVAYTGGPVGAQGPVVRIALAQTVALIGATVPNATYAALSMRDGDGFAKKFGGASGDHPDDVLLTTTRRDSNKAITGSVDFALAITASPVLRWTTS